jgi:hypothetical protein
MNTTRPLTLSSPLQRAAAAAISLALTLAVLLGNVGLASHYEQSSQAAGKTMLASGHARTV